MDELAPEALRAMPAAGGDLLTDRLMLTDPAWWQTSQDLYTNQSPIYKQVFFAILLHL